MSGFSGTSRWSVLKCAASAKYRLARRTVQGYTRPRYRLGEETPIQSFYDGPLFDPLRTRAGLSPLTGIPPYGLPGPAEDFSWLDGATDLNFSIDPARSFFGDCINVVDAPNEQPLDPWLPPFGWSGRPLVGGLAMTFSVLAGSLLVRMSPEQDGFIDLSLSHGKGLNGQDGVLSTPSGYAIAVRENCVRDAMPHSHARLEIATGRLHNFHYNVLFENSAIRLLCETNPGLTPPPLLFPGLPHAGHTMGWLEVTADGERLAIHIIAQQFLPLGPTVEDRPLLMPPSDTSSGPHEPFSAACSALHPFISIVAQTEIPKALRSAAASSPRQLESYRNRPTLPAYPATGSLADYANRVVTLKCLPGATDFGDNFSLVSPHLGGGALARSPLFGTLKIQFGPVIDGKIAFALRLAAPTRALHSKVDRLLELLPPGTEPGLVGMHGALQFPRRTYLQHELSLTTDPYKVSVGVADVATGRFEDMILRKYLFQNVMRNLLIAEPRTPTDSFCYVCDGKFSVTEVGLFFQLYGDFTIPYPEGYAFPLPGGRATRIGPGSHLLPFVNIGAVEDICFRPGSAPFKFRSSRALRGTSSSGVTLRIEDREYGSEALLQVDNVTVKNELTALASTELRTLQIVELELRAWDPSSRRPENIYAMLLSYPDHAQLLMVSERENFDSWMEGTAAFRSASKGIAA